MVGRRRAAGATVPVCAALICAIVGQAQGQQRQTLAPTFVWSPDAYISAGPGGVTSRVSYEVGAHTVLLTYVDVQLVHMSEPGPRTVSQHHDS